MAQRVQAVMTGADVDSRSIVIARHGEKTTTRIENSRQAIRDWLKQQPGLLCLAVEATGCYHIDLVELAHAHGVEVYLINPFQLTHYRKSVGVRVKTDPCDARLLARYLAHEQDSLRRWQPPPKGQRQAWRLLHRRAKLVKARQILQQSFEGMTGFGRECRALWQRLARLEKALEARLFALLQQLGWGTAWRRCQSICGIGPLSAAALVIAYHRGAFRHADAFVAFLGLDVRIRQSGRYTGQAKLTKQGDSEARRVLHNAAVTAARFDFKPYYERLRARGLASTQAHVAVTRKLVRIAFSLMQSGQMYDPMRYRMA